jgi:hypothetical protein
MTKEQPIIVSLIGHDTHNDFIIMLSWNCSFLFLMINILEHTCYAEATQPKIFFLLA